MLKWCGVVLGCCVSFVAAAGTMGETQGLLGFHDEHPWSVVGSLGYTYYQDAANGGGTALGRLAIGKELFNLSEIKSNSMPHALSKAHVGVEFGVQNGNRMSLRASQTQLDDMGSLPVWTTVKPMLDLLATLHVSPHPEKTPAFLVVKGGVAWREWMMERDTINNLSQAAGEIQAGVGMPISESSTLSVVYQGIYGAQANFTVNETTTTGHVANIPVQNGVLLSLSIML